MLYDLYNSGYLEARIDNQIKSLREQIIIDKNQKHTIEIIMDRIPMQTKMKQVKSELGKYQIEDKESERRLSEAIEKAVELSNGLVTIIFPDKTEETYSTLYSCPQDGYSFPEIEPRLFSFNSPYGYCPACTGLGTENLYSEKICPDCQGKRLNNNALNVKLLKKNIWEITNLTIAEAKTFFANLSDQLPPAAQEICGAVLKEIQNRLDFMFNVGLHYLTLNRRAGTLSGGEAQRIRLASQIGTRLVGALYVLDEPTIGLHQKDNEQLVNTLRNLCDIGNSIIVVEHDEDTILASDWMVDIGPEAGKNGGQIIFSGPTDLLLSGKKGNQTKKDDCLIIGDAQKSLTGQYLRGEIKIPTPKNRRQVDKGSPQLKIKGAKEHNLKNLSLEIPLRRLVCLTGVSGSGKSTLMHDIIHQAVASKLYGFKKLDNFSSINGTEYLDRIIVIDQSPIGRTSRSNPATYTKAFDEIRELFAATPEAKMRGFGPSRFSFNVPATPPEAGSRRNIGGRCENCEGKGVLEIEMHFLPSVEIVCDVCKGKRFNNETLQIHYNEKNIADILEMTIAEAEIFFRDIPSIYDKLKILNEVGLDYLTLGQSASTLSGGEAQRIKLSKELAKRGTTKTLYLLDEPTTGLHYEDVKKLLEVLQRLTSQGNTVMVIEHNLDVIKCADWLIDLGPEGGDKGGEIIAQGTPEEVARTAGSYTGQYLKRVLK